MALRVEVLANGATYRPRKPVASQFVPYGYDEEPCLIVWRTHDLETAERIMVARWQAEYGPVDLPAPRRTWLKTVPWNTGGHDGDHSIVEVDPKRGTPCVEYRYRNHRKSA